VQAIVVEASARRPRTPPAPIRRE